MSIKWQTVPRRMMDKTRWQDKERKAGWGDAFRLAKRHQYQWTAEQMLLCQELHKRR